MEIEPGNFTHFVAAFPLQVPRDYFSSRDQARYMSNSKLCIKKFTVCKLGEANLLGSIQGTAQLLAVIAMEDRWTRCTL